MDAVRRLGRGLPCHVLDQLTTAKSVLVLENAGAFIGFLDDLYGYKIAYPFKGSHDMCVDPAVVQLLPLSIRHLHSGVYQRYSKIAISDFQDSMFKYSVIRRRLDKHPVNYDYFRLFILGDRRPLLITETYSDIAHVDQRFWDGERWPLYYQYEIGKPYA